MKTNLTVEDPLDGQEVTIVITLLAGVQPRDERAALVSVGIAEQPPALMTGLFGELPALIDAAWNAYGLQAQLAAAAPAAATLVAEEDIPPSAATTPAAAVPRPPVPPAVPRPQAQNLSLF